MTAAVLNRADFMLEELKTADRAARVARRAMLGLGHGIDVESDDPIRVQIDAAIAALQAAITTAMDLRQGYSDDLARVQNGHGR